MVDVDEGNLLAQAAIPGAGAQVLARDPRQAQPRRAQRPTLLLHDPGLTAAFTGGPLQDC